MWHWFSEVLLPLCQESLGQRRRVIKEHPRDDDEALIQEHHQSVLGISEISQPIPGAHDVDGANDDSQGQSDSYGPTDSISISSPAQAFKLWMESLEYSYKCLTDRIVDNHATKTPGGGWPLELSMVATYATETLTGTGTESDPSPAPLEHLVTPNGTPVHCACSRYNIKGNPVVLIVAWSDTRPNFLTGRVCDVKDNKVLALVPARHSIMHFQSAEMILHSVHLRPHKSGPSDRPLLPELALRCHRMWEAALARLHALPTESVSLEACVWCGKHEKDNHQDHQDQSTDSSVHMDDLESGEPVFVCALCLLPCHKSCSANAISTAMNLDFSSTLPTLDVNVVPKRFRQPGIRGHTALCTACEHLLPGL